MHTDTHTYIHIVYLKDGMFEDKESENYLQVIYLEGAKERN